MPSTPWNLAQIIAVTGSQLVRMKLMCRYVSYVYVYNYTCADRSVKSGMRETNITISQRNQFSTFLRVVPVT